VEASHGGVVRAVGLDVDQRRQPLLEVGAEVGVHDPGLARPTADEPAAAREVRDARQREHGERATDAPVLAPQQGEHTEKEQCAAEYVDHEAGEEPGDRGDVAVDALQQLPGAVIGVEPVVEGEHVGGQVGS
jgi:hypothetical protein